MEEYSRALPRRIVADCGGVFTMGTIGGGIFQAIKGFRSSPVGVNHRLRGSLTAIKTRAPQLGGSFAVWGGMFSTIDCGMARCAGRRTPGTPSRRCLDRSHPGSRKRTGGHGRLSRDGWHPPGLNRRSWHLVDEICLCTVSQRSPVCRRPLPAAFGPVTGLAFWRLSAVSVGLLSQNAPWFKEGGQKIKFSRF